MAVTAALHQLHPVRLMFVALVVVFAGLSVAVVARSVEPFSYASTSLAAALVDLAAGIGLIGAGGYWLISVRTPVVGVVTAFAGVVWLSTDWAGWEDGPPIVRSTAMVTAPFLLAVLIHLGAAVPAGSIRGRPLRAAVWAVYAVTVTVSLGWALWRDPFYDRFSWHNYTDNSFLLHAEPRVARTLTTSWLVFALVAGIAVVATCAARLGRASSAARQQLIPLLAAVALAAVGQAAYAGLLLADPAEDPRRSVFVGTFYARALGLVALAAAIVVTTQRRTHTRRSLTQLATELGTAPPPGALRAALARTLGDDGLDIAYWLSAAQRYVDADGRRVEPGLDPEQAVTAIERNGSRVAVVVHDRSLQQTDDLERQIGAASRLVVDNERLRAQALAQVVELQESRIRIVATADDTRRRLERNLHDGAQQRLLALSYMLQRASAAARAGGAERRAAVLDHATVETTKALEELRELANGIYPTILADSGIGPALASFADVAPLRVELLGIPDIRFDISVETAAYQTVVELATQSYKHGGRRVCATFTVDGNRLVIELTSDGLNPDPEELIDVNDRLGALGGRIDVSGTVIQGVIPCG